MKQIETVRETLNKILESDAKNKIAIDGLKELDRKEKKLKKYEDKMNDKIKTKNVKKFRNLVNQRSLMNDFKFFKEKLSVDEQQKIIHEVEEINKVNLVQKPYRLSLLECDIPANLKAVALNKISSLRFMDPGSGEYYKIKNWVDTFMQIPFNNFKSLPLTIDDGVDKCSEFIWIHLNKY
jgi:ATP-dependent Lon protease